MPIPKEWVNGTGNEGQAGDYEYLQIEHDRMIDGEPFVVTLYGRNRDAGQSTDYLFCATPEQAREMADALRLYADDAERATAALPSRETDVPKET